MPKQTPAAAPSVEPLSVEEQLLRAAEQIEALTREKDILSDRVAALQEFHDRIIDEHQVIQKDREDAVNKHREAVLARAEMSEGLSAIKESFEHLRESTAAEISQLKQDKALLAQQVFDLGQDVSSNAQTLVNAQKEVSNLQAELEIQRKGISEQAEATDRNRLPLD